MSENKGEDSRTMGVPHSLKERSTFVLNLIDTCEMELVGGKAYNISALARKGFEVPQGFCITTSAYRYFMDLNSISEEDEPICTSIQQGIMPSLLKEVIMEAYNTYVDGPCAVRSSSPLEDLKRASFAGQYKSVLNVTGETLLDAVKECWALLWSKSVTEYRKKMGISKSSTMAVLVQKMIPATASGVLFTGDEMIIEGVWGLGDILVGGKVIPDRFTVERKGLKIKKREISHKEVMSCITADGGTEAEPVPEDLKNVSVLNDTHICALCSLGSRVEDFFGCPQDIEWVFHNDEIILLQARPITVTEPTVWSRANAAETMPGYATYLSRIPEDRPDDIVLGLTPLLECFGIKEEPENLKFREYIYGHIYLNMTTVGNVLGQIPGLSKDVLYQSLGHTENGTAQTPELSISTIVKLLPGTLRVLRFFLQLPKRAAQVIPYSIELINDIRHKNLQELTLAELDDLVWEMYERNSQVFQVHSVTALAVFALFGIVQKVVARAGEEGMENMLTIGLEGMSSSQLGVEMWKLAQTAAQSPRICELIF